MVYTSTGWLAGWINAAGRKGQLLRAIQEEEAAAGFLVVTGCIYSRQRQKQRQRQRQGKSEACKSHRTTHDIVMYM